jgi:hypothetical protein
MTIIGLSATAYAKKAGWRYFGMCLGAFVPVMHSSLMLMLIFEGLFLIIAGASGSIPGILAYVIPSRSPATPSNYLRASLSVRK